MRRLGIGGRAFNGRDERDERDDRDGRKGRTVPQGDTGLTTIRFED
jgi:hypothetical protein